MTATKTPKAGLDELRRQTEILERQEHQFDAARPRARFAYAAHITKTKTKIAQLEQGLSHDEWETWKQEHYVEKLGLNV